MKKLKIHAVYRHFKGQFYFIEDIVTSSVDCSKWVLYRELYGDRALWIRPIEEFSTKVDEREDNIFHQLYRFEEVFGIDSIRHKE